MKHLSRVGVVTVRREPDQNPDERKRDPRDWTWQAVSSKKTRSGAPIMFHGAEHSQHAALNAGFESLSFVGCPDRDRRGRVTSATREEARIKLWSKFSTTDFE